MCLGLVLLLVQGYRAASGDFSVIGNIRIYCDCGVTGLRVSRGEYRASLTNSPYFKNSLCWYSRADSRIGSWVRSIVSMAQSIHTSWSWWPLCKIFYTKLARTKNYTVLQNEMVKMFSRSDISTFVNLRSLNPNFEGSRKCQNRTSHNFALNYLFNWKK